MSPRMRARPTRRERQEQTREQLLDAASRVFARRGFTEATVEEIAGEAGYTTGAVYSNFSGKEELFRAAFEHQVVRDIESVTSAQARTADTPAERTRASAQTWMALLRDRPEMFLLLVEQWARAIRDPSHRASFVEHFRLFREATTRWVFEEAERGGYALPIPAEQIALGANAILFGVAFEYLADRDSVPESALETLEIALLRGIMSRSGSD
jgi:AcrR family transcriptional regulator